MRGARWVLVWGCGGVLCVACSMPLAPGSVAAPSSAPVVACAGSETAATTGDAVALAALRRSAETGPLYAALLTASPLLSCLAGGESGVPTLKYRFTGGAWLLLKRDTRIEHTAQEVHFVSPPMETPAALLARAEQAAFGAAGCGIDWQQAVTRGVEANGGATDTVFRGDVCNCQARIRRDARGNVVALALSSTC